LLFLNVRGWLFFFGNLSEDETVPPVDVPECEGEASPIAGFQYKDEAAPIAGSW